MHSSLLLAATLATSVSAHFLINYPQDRGNSYNSQFQFPCGGMQPTTNRSFWPTNGGAISLVPLHDFAFTTINIAIGDHIQETTDVNRFNHVMKPIFNQTGGNGTFCIDKVNIPASLKPLVKDGVNATIQVVQLVGSGAALYNCADITFSDAEAIRFAGVWLEYCFNSTGMGANYLTNADTKINYTDLALQELQLKMAAGSHVTIAAPVLIVSLVGSITMIMAGLW